MPPPPALAQWLLQRHVPEPTRTYLLGDLEERFRALARTSPVRARVWYWRQTMSALLRPVPGTAGVAGGWTLGWLGTDLRHGLRTLRRRPSESLAAVLMLALGIGAVATAVSILWGTVLRGLPFEDAERLVHFERARLAEGVTSLAVTPHDYLAWREAQRSFEDLGAYVERDAVIPNVDGPPDRYVGVAISAASFALLRVEPAEGRAFSVADEAPGAAPVVLLSHALWVSRFGGDPRLVGGTLSLNGRPTTVVGIMPERFGFPVAEQFWVPLTIDLSTLDRGTGRLDVFGRLRPGVSLAQARTEFAAITDRIAAVYPGTNEGISASLRSFHDEYVGPEFTQTVYRMLAGAVLVLLVCCANVANLLLVRGSRRRRTLEVQMALGATRLGVARQLLMESLLLAGAGALGGIGVAWYGLAWFNRVGTQAGVFSLPHGTQSLFWWDVGLDLPTFVAIFGVMGITAVLAGLAPAVGGARVSTLRGRPGNGTGMGPRRILAGIVVGQLALTSGLLVAAGFVFQSVRNVSDVSERFDVEGVLVASLAVPSPDHDHKLRFTEELLERLADHPGVTAAAFATDVPLDPPRFMSFRVDGAGDGEGAGMDDASAGVLTVSTSYFRLFGIDAVQGRVFTAEDRAGSAPVALVNQRFAERYLAGRSPVGAKVRIGSADEDQPWAEIVGVVPDLWERPGAPEREAGVYVPLAQSGTGDPRTRLGPWGLTYQTVAVRQRSRGSVTAQLFRDQVYALDAALPVGAVQTMTEITARRMGRYRVWGSFYLSFAAAALVLAAVGIYGVLSFTVTLRTAEFGVRRALGASAASVQTDVVQVAFRRVVVGLLLGLGLGKALADSLGQVLYGVETDDLAVFVTVGALVAGVAVLASWGPARRAAGVDPLIAMRAD